MEEGKREKGLNGMETIVLCEEPPFDMCYAFSLYQMRDIDA